MTFTSQDATETPFHNETVLIKDSLIVQWSIEQAHQFDIQ